MADITWTRGDTKNLRLRIKLDGNPVDLSGYTSITLCVNSEKKPTDISNEQFKSVGVPDPDQVGNIGWIDFPMVGHEDYLGTFYYDIQAIESGLKDTFIKGYKFIYEQDINKD